MKYPDMNQYITLLFSLLAEFLTTQNPPRRRGRPRRYTVPPCSSFTPRGLSRGLPRCGCSSTGLVQHPRMRAVPLAGVSLACDTQPPVCRPGPPAAGLHRVYRAPAGGVLLLTPRTAWAQAQGVLGAACGVAAPQVSGWQASRKTAIEPVFDLLSCLLSTRGPHKPLPVRGLGYVSTFLGWVCCCYRWRC